jgi:WD40 repeat protein
MERCYWKATGKPDRKLEINAQFVSGLVFSPDSKQLAVSGSSDGEKSIRIWDLTNPDKPRCLLSTPVNHPVNAVAFSPDGKVWAGTTDPTKKDRVWVNYLDGAKKSYPLNLPAAAAAIAFSRDGRIVAVANGNVVGLYDWRSGLPGATVAVLKGHNGRVNSVKYSPDGRFIATASNDGTARLWDAETGTHIAGFAAEKSGYLNTAEFTPDSKSLVTAGEDSVVRIWDLMPFMHVKVESVPGTQTQRYTATFTDNAGHPRQESEVDSILVELKFAKAATIADQLKPKLSPAGEVVVDHRKNTITVRDTVANLRIFSNWIAEIDKAPPKP